MLLKLRLFCLASLACLVCFAQPNNPYNTAGATLAADLTANMEEIRALKLSELNQAKLDELQGKFRTKISINESQLGDYLEAIQKNSKEAIISASNFSEESKEFLKKLSSGESALPNYNFDALNTKILSSKIAENEKEILLTISATQFNLMNRAKTVSEETNGAKQTKGGPKELSKNIESSTNGCDLNVVNHETGVATTHHVEPTGCGAALGAVGAMVGAGICGGPCALGGFVVGFFAGWLGTK